MPKTIVWIEDDSDIIEPVIRPLQQAGHLFVRLRTATEALEAVEQIREADLILIDLIVPPGGAKGRFGRYAGLDVLRELREVHNVETPAVLLTVVTREEVVEQAKQFNVVDVVRKPVLPSELKERVERALGLLGE